MMKVILLLCLVSMCQALTLEAGRSARSTEREDKGLFDFLEPIQVAIDGFFNSKEADPEI